MSDLEVLAGVVAQANKLFALKDYTSAADKYAQAAEEAAKANGEDDPRNADILFLYGRCLFRLALERSQVLGAGSGGEQPAAGLAAVGATPNVAPQGPLFSFEGDEPDEQDEDEPVPEEADEDEFQNAWEVLDVVRVMYSKQADGASETELVDINRKLSDTFDLLGEIALENEQFDQAAADLRTALTFKEAAYPPNARERSSAHYMLAIALEYATAEGSREAAAQQLRHAVDGFEARLTSSAKPDEAAADSDEAAMLSELKIKLSELEAPPEKIMKDDIAKLFNTDDSSLKDSLVAAMQTSTDLTTLVRKKGTKRAMPESEAATKKSKLEAEDS